MRPMLKQVLLVSFAFLLAGCGEEEKVSSGASAAKGASVEQNLAKQSGEEYAKARQAEMPKEKKEKGVPSMPESGKKKYDTANPVVKIETTMGGIVVELFPKEAPKTVENFLTLTKKGFYDGIIFHRVIPGFMIQTGDPTGTGMGGPGYKFGDEFSKNLRHDRAGRLSMANAGPGTNGSQFFLTLGPTTHLDDKHSIFGQVIEGQEVVVKIGNAPRDRRDKPLEAVKMTSVRVVQE